MFPIITYLGNYDYWFSRNYPNIEARIFDSIFVPKQTATVKTYPTNSCFLNPYNSGLSLARVADFSFIWGIHTNVNICIRSVEKKSSLWVGHSPIKAENSEFTSFGFNCTIGISKILRMKLEVKIEMWSVIRWISLAFLCCFPLFS